MKSPLIYLHDIREALRASFVKGRKTGYVFEFVSFGVKQAWACLFGGLMLAILLLILGVQFILFGLIGEMQTRIYHESQDKPVYYVRDTIGWPDDKSGG